MGELNNYILFAEDDVEDQMIISGTFTDMKLGNELVFVDNGEKLMAKVQVDVQLGHLPALIVLDLNMPLLNGTETLQLLKASQHYNAIPVVIFSTSVNHAEKEKCMALGATNYIVKPDNYDQCVKTVSYFHSFCQGGDNRSN